jgi:hypothetical protein
MGFIAPFIPAIISGVGTVFGAHEQASGQEKAAQTQSDAAKQASADQLKAAEDALAFQKQQYRNTQIATAPYQNMGAGALAALGSGLGVTPGNIAPTPISTAPDRGQGTTTSGLINPADLAQFNANQQTPSGFPNLTASQQRIDAQNPASTQNLSQSSVRLQSPDGKETQTVPANQAHYYISQGAKVVA